MTKLPRLASDWQWDRVLGYACVPHHTHANPIPDAAIAKSGQPNKKGTKTMTTETKNQPAYTERYGNVKGVIWRNYGDEGTLPYYTVNYVRSYTDDDGNWKDTQSLSETDNLKQGIVNDLVAKRIIQLKAADREARNN